MKHVFCDIDLYFFFQFFVPTKCLLRSDNDFSCKITASCVHYRRISSARRRLHARIVVIKYLRSWLWDVHGRHRYFLARLLGYSSHVLCVTRVAAHGNGMPCNNSPLVVCSLPIEFAHLALSLLALPVYENATQNFRRCWAADGFKLDNEKVCLA